MREHRSQQSGLRFLLEEGILKAPQADWNSEDLYQECGLYHQPVHY